jgi:hypothetical protein
MRYAIFILFSAALSGQTVINGGRTFLGPVDVSGATAAKPWPSRAAAPATCSEGEKYFNTTDKSDYKCTPDNNWTGMGSAAGGELTIPTNSGATGASVLKTGTNVVARKIIGGTGITVTENADDITLTGPGLNTLLPVQAGQAGKTLTTDGANASWVAPEAAGASSAILAGYGNGSAIVAGGSNYFTFGMFSGSISEASGDVAMPRPATIRNLMVKTSAAQPASQALTCTVRKILAAAAYNAAGVDTPVQVVVAAGSAAGWYSSTGTVSLAAGDRITLGCAQQAGTSPSAPIRMFSVEAAN